MKMDMIEFEFCQPVHWFRLFQGLANSKNNKLKEDSNG